MGLLTDAAREAATKRQRNNHQSYSDTHVLVGIVMSVGCVAFLLWQTAFGAPVVDRRTATAADVAPPPAVALPDATPPPTLPAAPAPPGSGDAPTDLPSMPAVATAPPTAPADDGQVTLLDAAGNPVPVDGDAVEVAAAGIRATFTGNYTGVEVDGQPPTPAQVWPDPQIGAPTILTALDGYLLLRVTVDPDGAAGTAPPRDVTGAAVELDGQWRFAI